jgi:hypothetical protein
MSDIAALRGAFNKNDRGVVCLDWRPCERGTLRGFAKVKVPSWHLTIDGLSIHESHGKRWAQLPSGPLLNDERELVREQDGKIRYAKILSFDDRDVSDRFSIAVVRAVEEFTR